MWSLDLYVCLYVQFVLSVLPTLTSTTSSPFWYIMRAVSRGTQYLILFMFILNAMRKTAYLRDCYEREREIDRQGRLCSRWARSSCVYPPNPSTRFCWHNASHWFQLHPCALPSARWRSIILEYPRPWWVGGCAFVLAPLVTDYVICCSQEMGIFSISPVTPISVLQRHVTYFIVIRALWMAPILIVMRPASAKKFILYV